MPNAFAILNKISEQLQPEYLFCAAAPGVRDGFLIGPHHRSAHPRAAMPHFDMNAVLRIAPHPSATVSRCPERDPGNGKSQQKGSGLQAGHTHLVRGHGSSILT